MQGDRKPERTKTGIPDLDETACSGDDRPNLDEKSAESYFFPLLFICGAPVVLLFYTIFYFIWPQPIIFDRDQIFEIFPNMPREHAHLVSIGLENFANNFVNFQMNMAIFCFIINIVLWVVFIPVFIFRDTPGERVSVGRMLGFIPIIYFMLMYPYGLWPIDRVDWHGKLNLNNKLDYIDLWLFISMLSFSVNAIIIHLIKNLRSTFIND